MDFPPVHNMVAATFNQFSSDKGNLLSAPQAPQPVSDSSSSGSNPGEGSGPNAAVTSSNSNPGSVGTVLDAEA